MAGKTMNTTSLKEDDMADIRSKIDELLAAHPELVEKVKNAPGEAADAIRKATGLNLDASDLDKVKQAVSDFVGEDGLDLGDFQRAFEALVAKGKEVAASIDTEAIKEGAADLANKGAVVAADLVAKGSAVAADLAAKGGEVAADLAAKAEAGKAAAEEAAGEAAEVVEAAAAEAAETVETAAAEAAEKVEELAAEAEAKVEEVVAEVEAAVAEEAPAEEAEAPAEETEAPTEE